MVGEYDGDHLDFRGGKFTGPFTAKAVYRERAPAPSALDALPARAVGFTGRETELRELLDAFDPSGSAAGPEAVLVAAVSGLGGIGKTALAVQAGYEARGKGWFPGGVLFVDLHGYDDEPVTGEQALEALLRALGTEPEHIPVGLDARAALYRSTLAGRAREQGPALVLADNASSPAQVRPLLPGGAGHRLLVTSRDRLPQLGARLMALGELTPEEAYDLLDRALRIAHPADGRVADNPEEAARLAALCGHLPLALQIAAALLVVDRDKPVAELTAELAESRDLLEHLDDGERSVRAAFDLSYKRLPLPQARALRLLALAPGPDASDEVVAALVGTDTSPIQALESLVRVHLVERRQEGGRRRWRLHDLVRAFGVGVVAADVELVEEGEAGQERVLDFFYRRAYGADRRLRWLPGRPVPEWFTDRAEALAWLDAERAGLVAASRWAGEERYVDTAVRLAESLVVYLRWRRHNDDRVTVGRAAQEGAHRVGDRKVEARAWNNLGGALRAVGRAEEAIEAHSHARDLHRATGNRRGEARAWNNLGIAFREVGRVEAAIEAHSHARDLHRATGNRHGEARAWNNLGLALLEVGRAGKAIEAHRRARDLHQVVEDRHGEAKAWNNLGIALRQVGLAADAIDAHSRARDLYQAVEDRHGEAIAWDNLGAAFGKVGRGTAAIDAYRQGLEIFREFEDWHRVGGTLMSLAFVHESAQARAYWLQAADAYTKAGATAQADLASALAEERR